MLNDETLQEIQEFAIAGDWNVAFNGTSHGNQHLFRIVKIAIFLADQLGADRYIVEAAAWLHDFPLTSGHDYNYTRNKQIADSVLDHFPLTDFEKNSIATCIAAHEGIGDIVSLEAQIIHDADVLEKTSILGIIRHTWKLTHSSQLPIPDSDTSITDIVFEHLQWRAKRLQTALAKDIHCYLVKDINMSSDFIHKLVSFIEPLARKNMITETIAKELKKKLTKTEYKKLEEQLSLNYLNLFEKKNLHSLNKE